MAGLLDVAEFFLTPRAFFGRRNAAKDAEQFAGLLGSLEQQGPVQPGGGLLQARAPDQQFWLKAAQIPSYQDMASQQLGYDIQQRGALGRQMQAQDFAANNLTAEQAANYGLNLERFGWNQQMDAADLQRKWAGTNATIASQGQSAALANLRQQQLIAQEGRDVADYQRKTGLLSAPLFDQLKPQEKVVANLEFENADNWTRGAGDVADYIQKRSLGSAVPWLGEDVRLAAQQEWMNTVKPAFAKAQNVGVIQPSEMEAMEKIMGAPADYVMTDQDIALFKTAAQKVEDMRQSTYRAYGKRAPQIKRGESSFSKALSGGQPYGTVKPKTFSDGNSGRVQRY